MRIQADVKSEQLATVLAEAASDRHVAVGEFVPIRTDFTSYLYQGVIAEFMTGVLWLLRGSLVEPQGLRKRIAPRARARALTAPRRRKTAAPAYSKGQRKAVDAVLSAVGKARSVAEAAAVYRAFRKGPDYESIHDAAAGAQLDDEDRGVFDAVTDYLDVLAERPPAFFPDPEPPRRPDATSELGYLFIDRTRVRPAGFVVGEHLYSLSLAPGEEVVLEQRSYRRETVSLEETLEHEFERRIESTVESSLTAQQGSSADESLQQGRDLGSNAQAGIGSIALGTGGASLPVNAGLGLDAGASLNQASNSAQQESVTLAQRLSDTVAARLRTAHRTTFKVSRETGLESSSRRVLRNPNGATPLSLHYFKVMQRLELQIERSGVRLCWAPFVRAPGSRLRQRMQAARDEVYARALARLVLPVRPQPRALNEVPQWFAAPVQYFLMHWTLVSDVAEVNVPILKDHEFTRRLRVRKLGPRAGMLDVMLDPADALGGLRPPADDDPKRDSLEGYVRVGVSVQAVWPPLPIIDTGTVGIIVEAEARRVVPNAAEDASHRAAVAAWESEVARLQREAADRARPEAEAAAQRVLATADIRSELLGAVIAQYVEVALRDQDREVELWHRLIDFDHIGYYLYPGWWDESQPYPDLGTHHFLNASWARVFLPVRELPGNAGQNEAGFMHLLYRPERFDPAKLAGYNTLVGNLVAQLKKEQGKYRNAQGKTVAVALGAAWETTVPTDGTHIEAVLSATTAEDAYTAQRQQAGLDLLLADVAERQADVSIKGQVATPVQAQVVLGDADGA